MDAGRKAYGAGLKIQDFVMNYVKTAPDQLTGVLILIEHDPVYTVGMRSEAYGVGYEYRFISLGADFYRTNRGGLLTFHGPGQLVAYPILNMTRLDLSYKSYISLLEQAVVGTCKKFGVPATTSPGNRGVWVEDRKISAIGVHVSEKNITSHGLSLECETDLKWYDNIAPCGIADKDITSLTKESKKRVRIEDVTDTFIENFGRTFNCRMEPAPPEFVREVRSKSDAL